MSTVAHAALAIALLAGGSGEPDAQKNFFLRDLADFRQALSARGWQVSVVAGEGTLKPLAKAASNFSLASETLHALEQARSGDRVLILFHSHGLRQRSEWGQKSHSITSEDTDASGAEPGFDLDRIEPALMDAAARGVKTALVDLSCYSGATLSLRGPSCTVTLASKKYISLCSGRPEERLFASRFFKLPLSKDRVSLETQFLQARRADLDSVNFPQISSRRTSAASAWDDFLETSDPLDVFEDLEDLRSGAKPFSAEKLLDAIKNPPAEISEKLKSTLAVRAKLEETMPALAADYDKEELTFDLPMAMATATGVKLKLAPALLAELLDAALKNGPKPEDWDDVQQHRLEQVRPARAGLAERFRAQLDAFRKRRKDFDRLKSQLQDEAGSLMSSERRLYDERSEPIPGQDGCRDFLL